MYTKDTPPLSTKSTAIKHLKNLNFMFIISLTMISYICRTNYFPIIRTKQRDSCAHKGEGEAIRYLIQLIQWIKVNL